MHRYTRILLRTAAIMVMLACESRAVAAGMAPDSLTAADPGPAAVDSMLGATSERAPAHRAADSARAVAGSRAADSLRRGAGCVDYLWVLRGSLASRASIDSVLARARRMGVRALLVQVVGRGDACYRSDILPPAEFLTRGPRLEFDPFDELLQRAHAQGFEVHAWINCLLVWSAPQPPHDLRHVVNSHPEWIARLRDGRKLNDLGARERERRGMEGVFLSAAHPGVRAWVAAVAREIAERYPVDGIHLDYIRDPTADVGWDATTRARFALQSGVDRQRTGQLSQAERAQAAAEWARFQQDQVTAIVRAVRDSVRAVRPDIQISAAVLADTLQAERWNAQMWREWLRDGLLDRAFPMCYAVPVQTVMSQLLRFALEVGPGRLVPGIAMYNTAPLTAALKIKGARALGYSRVALYSYDSLFGDRNYWHALQDQFRPGAQGNR